MKTPQEILDLIFPSWTNHITFVGHQKVLEAMKAYSNQIEETTIPEIRKEDALKRVSVIPKSDCCFWDNAEWVVEGMLEMRSKLIPVIANKDKTIRQLKESIDDVVNKNLSILPTDSETEEWFTLNIGEDCSASSGIYKFRLWLKERNDKSKY